MYYLGDGILTPSFILCYKIMHKKKKKKKTLQNYESKKNKINKNANKNALLFFCCCCCAYGRINIKYMSRSVVFVVVHGGHEERRTINQEDLSVRLIYVSIFFFCFFSAPVVCVSCVSSIGRDGVLCATENVNGRAVICVIRNTHTLGDGGGGAATAVRRSRSQ